MKMKIRGRISSISTHLESRWRSTASASIQGI